MILDARSLACLRIGTAIVLLCDMLRALAVAPDWWRMQGYDPTALPAVLRLVDPTVTLQLATLVVAGASLVLAIGWHTRPFTWMAWTAACAFQFAASASSDYHNAVLCTLLLWSLLLPTGARFSLDAVTQRGAQPAWLTRVGSAGLALSLAWLYLSTAMAKTGAAWWPDGSAVWLALLDRSTPADLGRWLALAAPAQVWPVLTYGVLLLEYCAPVLLLWPRSRALAVMALGLLHAGMWLLMDLGSFPLVMLVGLSALIPGTVWDRVGWMQLAWPLASTRRNHKLSAAWVAACLVLSIGGESLVDRRRDSDWPFAGAEQVARFYYLLGLETTWRMYAPEPLRQTGWWVAVGWLGDGSLMDPITSAKPTTAAPPTVGAGALRRWLVLSHAPESVDGLGPQHAYRNLLIGTADAPLHRLALVWMHEPLTPFEPPPAPTPLYVLDWPQGSVGVDELATALNIDTIQTAQYDSSGGLLGAVSLSPVAH